MRILLGRHVSERWKSLLGAYLPYVQLGTILLLGIVSYVNTLDVPVMFDDYHVIRFTKDYAIDAFKLPGLFQRPRWLADLTFYLNRQLHGDRVLGYHLFNLAIHLSSACVIFLLVQRTIEALKQTFQIPLGSDNLDFLQRFIPIVTAALFVCHPVQTQAVTYISQRYTSLATFLYLSSLLAYLHARLSFAASAVKRDVLFWGAASILLALLAMKSKETAFTLPLMAAALEAAIFRGKMLKNPCMMALAAGLLLFIPLQMIFTHGGQASENLLDQIHSTTAETREISRTDYLLTQFRVVATYLRLLILPINQNLDYDYPVFHSLLNPSVSASLLLHIILAGVALALFIWSQKKMISGDTAVGMCMRLGGLGIVWFYLTLSVESGLIPIRDVIFEHRMYLPSVGFCMTVTACLAGIALQGNKHRKAVWGVVLLICLVLTVSTVARNRLWKDELSMWQDVLKKSPRKARISYNVGFIYFRGGMPEKALPYLVKALELDSKVYQHWFTLNCAIPMIAEYQGRSSNGMGYVISYEKVDPARKIPWQAIGYNNLGLAYEHLGNLTLARGFYRKAATSDTSLDIAWFNLALLAARQDDFATVEESLKRLRELNPVMEQSTVKSIQKLTRSIQVIPQ